MCLLRKTIHQNPQPPSILQRRMQKQQPKRKKKNLRQQILLQKSKKKKPNPNRNKVNRPTQTRKRWPWTNNRTKWNPKNRTPTNILNVRTIYWIWVKNVIQSKKLPESRNNLPKMQSRPNPQRPKPRGNLLHRMRIHTTRQQHTTHNTGNRRRPAWHQIYKGPMAEKTEKKINTLYNASTNIIFFNPIFHLELK